MHWLTIAFLIALATHLVVEFWLSARQVQHVDANRDVVPPAFAGTVTTAEHQKAADYTMARQRLSRLDVVIDAAVLLALTLGGGIAWLREVAWSTGLPEVLAGTAHVLLVFLLVSSISMPISIWRTFVLEERFGFNRTTARTFLVDLAKSLVLGAVLGGAVIATVLWIMSSAGRYWWIIGWLAWTAFSMILLWAWPRWIAGFFNKFSPLEDAALRQRIDALVARCGFKASDVYVMDGSRRSAHGNAYFTGLGKEKRIVFFDTLLQSLSPAQVEAVLAHELAHFKLRHIPQRLVVGALTTLVGFGLLGWLASQDWFYAALGVDRPGNSSALLLFLFAMPTFTWVISPLMAAWSRRHEFEADEFAARYSDGPELARALVKMYQENASTLTPDPLHSAFYDSHPPPVTRISRLAPRDSAPPAAPSGRSPLHAT
jgi:STE24 endopeptidase